MCPKFGKLIKLKIYIKRQLISVRCHYVPLRFCSANATRNNSLTISLSHFFLSTYNKYVGLHFNLKHKFYVFSKYFQTSLLPIRSPNVYPGKCIYYVGLVPRNSYIVNTIILHVLSRCIITISHFFK